MKRPVPFKFVGPGQVFFAAGGRHRSLVKTSDTQASATWPHASADTEVIEFDPEHVVRIATDDNRCDDAFVEIAVRDSSMRFDFSRALYLLKTRDCSVTRVSWANDGNPVVFLSPGTACFTEQTPASIAGVPSYLFQSSQSGGTRMPMLNLKYPSGRIAPGWMPTLDDMLAEDWFVHPTRRR